MIRNLRPLPSSSSETDETAGDRPLRLATWYRAQAERAGCPWIWEARLQRAEELERQARDRADHRPNERSIKATA